MIHLSVKKSRTLKKTVSSRLLITCQRGSDDGHSDEVSRRSEKLNINFVSKLPGFVTHKYILTA